jgi:hypothetical protein
MTELKKPKWDRLTSEQQDLYIKVLWEDSCSELAIARFLDTTKGTIVGRRHRHPNIAPTDRNNVRTVVNVERFYDLLELHKMAQFEKENGVIAIVPISPNYRPPQNTSTCEWPVVMRGGRTQPCGEPTEPGSKLCARHGSAKKRRRS